jgi:hypothetical protein
MTWPTVWEVLWTLSRIFFGPWKHEKGGSADAAFGGAGQIGGAGSILKYRRRKNQQKNNKTTPNHACVCVPAPSVNTKTTYSNVDMYVVPEALHPLLEK